ncbi:hypothetical protein CUZ56_00579 [Saezia sanguinis]|uniref:Uncharacterized protein n=1 Tax=Saezia sanguinis TaxID=1965230 RepID=A0A433SHF2_9BURK|nr:hypothetical protein [Saezia sanguinis]RUS68094.1 hypothetical protein CUZ56_00579 [Saezia sanguinis]
MSTQNSAHRITTPSTTEYGRPLLSLPEIRELVCQVDCGLEALLELLWQSQNNLIHPESVHTLLKPLSDILSQASGDLNDMRF